MAQMGFQTAFPQPAATPPVSGSPTNSPATPSASPTAVSPSFISGPASAAPATKTPLSFDQFQQLRQKGLSVQQIANFSSGQTPTGTPAGTPPSFGQKLGNAFSQTMQSLPGFLEAPLHILDPIAKGAATAIQSIKATPQLLSGNWQGAQQTMSQPLTASPSSAPGIGGAPSIPTLGSSTNLQNLGSAAEAASLLPGLGEVSSITAGTPLRAAVQGSIAGGVGGGGQYLANSQNPSLLGTIGAVSQGAAGGAIAGAASPGLLEKAQQSPGQNFADLGQGIKNVGQSVASIPSKIQASIEGPTLQDTISNLDDQIKQGIDKGVKPTVVGKKTTTQSDAFYEKAAGAIKTVADLRDQLNLTDASGEPLDSAPKTAAQAAQAIDQAKVIIYNQYSTLAKAAGDEGATFDAAPTVAKLTKVATDLGNTPELRNYAKSSIPEIQELQGQSPDVVERRIAEYNKSLKGYYQGNVTAAKASVDAGMASELRNSLDESISNAKGPGYQDLKSQYGELKTLEGEMNHRAIVNSRQNPINLTSGLTDIFGGGSILRGILTGNIGDVAMGVGGKAISTYIKSVNSPDANIGRMFDAVYSAKDAASAAGFDSLRNLTPDLVKTAQTTAALTNKQGGATISPQGDIPTEGYSTATSKATERILDKPQVTRQDVLKYISDNYQALQQEGAHIGAWVDNGKVYLDTPTVFNNLPDAAKAAQAADQLGLYDLKAGRTIERPEYEKAITDAQAQQGGNGGAVQPAGVAKPPTAGVSGGGEPQTNSGVGQPTGTVSNPEGIVKNAADRQAVIDETIQNRATPPTTGEATLPVKNEVRNVNNIEPKTTPTNTLTKAQQDIIDNLTPEEKAAYLDHKQKTAEVYPQFKDQITQLAKDNGVDFKVGRKGDPRAIEKGITEKGGNFSNISDMNRGYLVANSLPEVKDIARQIIDNFDVVKEKDRFMNPDITGYRDELFQVKMPNSTIAEIQIHVPEMIAAKGELHPLYEKTRVATPGSPEYNKAMTAQQKGYNAAWQKFTKRGS